MIIQAQLLHRMGRVDALMGRLLGRDIEARYREHVVAHFGRVLRRPKPVDHQPLADALEPHLTAEEQDDVLLLDLILSGGLASRPGAPEVLLGMEISAAIDQSEVARAVCRVDLLRRAGKHAIPVVAGDEILPDAEDIARDRKVVVLQDGRRAYWSEAVDAWVPPLPAPGE